MASLPRTRVQPPIHTGTVVDEHTIHAHGACGMVYANLDPGDRTLDVIVFHDDHPVGLHLTIHPRRGIAIEEVEREAAPCGIPNDR